MAIASRDDTGKIWEAATGKEIFTLTGHTRDVIDLEFDPEGARIVTGSRDHSARIWNVETGENLFVLQGHEDEITDVEFSPDGGLVATASDDGTARIWEVATGQEIVVLRGHSAEVTDVEFSPEGDRILTASWDGSIRTWEVISGSPLFVMRGPTNPVRRASFDRGGLRVLSSSTDNTIRIWSAIDGEQLSVLSGHGGSPKTWTFPDGRVLSIGRTAIDDAGFSPNGARVISASDDGTVRIWDSETGAVLAVLAAHDGPITSARFSSDGLKVVTTSSDLTARVWRTFVDTQEVVEYFKNAAPWCMTRAQRAQFFLDQEPPQWCVDARKRPYDRAFLGVGFEALSPRQAQELELPTEGGARVVNVIAGSPAERAGLIVGDIIVYADGYESIFIDLSTLYWGVPEKMTEYQLATTALEKSSRRTSCLGCGTEMMPPILATGLHALNSMGPESASCQRNCRVLTEVTPNK